MTESFVIELMQSTLMLVGLISAPVLVANVGVGVAVSVLQTVTQIKDQSLTFVPKTIAVALVLVIFWPWYMQLMQEYWLTIFDLMIGVAQ